MSLLNLTQMTMQSVYKVSEIGEFILPLLS